jgi:hypothetical protein
MCRINNSGADAGRRAVKGVGLQPARLPGSPSSNPAGVMDVRLLCLLCVV